MICDVFLSGSPLNIDVLHQTDISDQSPEEWLSACHGAVQCADAEHQSQLSQHHEIIIRYRHLQQQAGASVKS